MVFVEVVDILILFSFLYKQKHYIDNLHDLIFNCICDSYQNTEDICCLNICLYRKELTLC